jgi:hypothetical protein
MSIRFAFSACTLVFSVAFFSAVGCDSQPASPAADSHNAAASTDDHDHQHADDEHAHNHAEEHAHDHDHEHDHAEGEHAHPESYAAAIVELEELRAAVEKASAEDDLAKADSQVHEIGHLLEDIGKLADKESVSDDAKTKINAAVEELMDAFEQIDAKIHGGDGKTYADVAEKVNASMTVLKANGNQEK